MEINLNDQVAFTLTPEGVAKINEMNEAAAKAFKEVTGKDTPSPLYNLINGDGLIISLWEAMVLLAPTLDMTKSTLVKDNKFNVMKG